MEEQLTKSQINRRRRQASQQHACLSRENFVKKLHAKLAPSQADYGQALLDDIFGTATMLRDSLDLHMLTVHDNVGSAAREAVRRGILADEHKKDFQYLSAAADAYRHMSRAKCAFLRQVVSNAIVGNGVAHGGDGNDETIRGEGHYDEVDWQRLRGFDGYEAGAHPGHGAEIGPTTSISLDPNAPDFIPTADEWEGYNYTETSCAPLPPIVDIALGYLQTECVAADVGEVVGYSIGNGSALGDRGNIGFNTGADAAAGGMDIGSTSPVLSDRGLKPVGRWASRACWADDDSDIDPTSSCSWGIGIPSDIGQLEHCVNQDELKIFGSSNDRLSSGIGSLAHGALPYGFQDACVGDEIGKVCVLKRSVNNQLAFNNSACLSRRFEVGQHAM